LLKVGASTTLTLSGNNGSYTGAVAVAAGTLKVLNGAALQTAASTTISNGAVLDIGLNSVDMGTNAITVSGSGQNGAGAIINSSGNAGFLVSNFKNLTLAGNTVIGGPGRLDLRATDATIGTDATLSTGGNGYSLTKVSSSQFQLAGVQVDNALGDIDIQGGIFGIQGAISSLGNPNNTLTIESGATFQLFNLQNVISKPVILKDGATVNSANNVIIYGGLITLQGTGLFNIGNGSLTLNNIVGGTGPLTKVTGTLPLILSGANTYSGGTVVNAGIISFSADNNFGALPSTPTPGNIILNGGGISASTDVTLSPNRGIAVGPATGTGSGTIDVASTLTYNGTIANNGSGVGSLVTSGATLYLAGTNTYTGNTTIGGNLALIGNGSISSSAQIILAGSLDASGRTDGTLTLSPGQTLSGAGNVVGNLTNSPGSTVSPMAGADGVITVFGSVTFQGTNVMNIDKDNGNQDTINSTAKITYGGTLVLIISNTFAPLSVGDAFPLYTAASYGGAFVNIIPASPGSGLSWNTNTLTTDGFLRVAVGPSFPTTNANIASVTLSGTNLLVHGTNNNVPNTSFRYAVLTSTNLALPLGNWTPVVTNLFNPDGTFDYTNPLVPSTPQQFINVEAVP
jgi:fibronectin-binding autotransporter adhesin